MTLANIVRLNIYVTDIQRSFSESQGVLASRLSGVECTSTLLGVASLAAPDLLVELEATAMA